MDAIVCRALYCSIRPRATPRELINKLFQITLTVGKLMKYADFRRNSCAL